jgi:two-component system, LuxR family, response regulator FixJ
MTANTGQVYVIDDEAGVRQTIDWVLSSVGYAVTTYHTAEEFLQASIGQDPYCVIVDLLLPGMTGLKLCRQTLAQSPACGFIVITGNGDVPSAVEAMRMGAVDFLQKPFGNQQLLESVECVFHTVRKRHQSDISKSSALGRLSKLTAREREVLGKIAAGLPSKAIATNCGISPRTVDVHRSRILQKLDIESPAQLAHFLAVVGGQYDAGLDFAAL